MRRVALSLLLALSLVVSILAGSTAVLAQGAVYTDTMDSAQTGLLSTETFDPAISFAYQNSQFVVTVQQLSYRGDITSELSVPEMASSRLTVDAFISGDPANKYVIAGCRHTEAGEGYFFGYLPATGDIILWRRDASGDTNIAQSVEPSLIASANTMYQIGIDCWTNVITGIVNGQPVLSAFDATYEVGRPTIGVGANGQETDGLTVSFDNLTVEDKGNLALGPETPVGQPAATTAQAVPIRDPLTDPAGTLEDAFTISLSEPPIVSGLGGEPELAVDELQALSAGVQVADFYAEVSFAAPTVPTGSSYLVGFCFWVEPDGSCYDIYLIDDGSGNAGWSYGYAPAVGDYQQLQFGDLPPGSLDPTPGAQNFLGLTVYQGVAILTGNTFEAGAVLSLQGTPIASDVQQELSLLADEGATVTETLPMSITDFAVWDLSGGLVPAAETAAVAATEPVPAPTSVAVATTAPVVASGPALPPVQGASAVDLVFDRTRTTAIGNPALVSGLSGSFTQERDVYAFSAATVSLADFYSIVTFTNPADVSAPFDVGIGFRADQGTESGMRFVVGSDNLWFVLPPGQEAIASGTAASFDVTAGASNTVELLVQGTTGIVAINGVVLPQFDLSLDTARGDAYVGAGFFQGDTVAGRVIAYSQWWIYPTDVLDIPSG